MKAKGTSGLPSFALSWNMDYDPLGGSGCIAPPATSSEGQILRVFQEAFPENGKMVLGMV